MNINVSTQIDPAVATFYDRVLLRRGLPFKNHALFAQRRGIKKRSGNTLKFRRYGSLAVATTPLSEGVTPSGKVVAKTDITATIKQYGDFVHYSDVVSLTNQDATLTEFTEVLGEQAGETMDVLARDVYVAGTSVYYAGSYASSAIDTRVEVNTAPVTSDFKKIRETLVGNKAKMISPIIKASTGQGTMPVAPAYMTIAHYELQNDLEDMSGWTPAYQYPSGMPSYPSEIGSLSDANMRFLINQNAKSWDAEGGTTGAGTTYRSSDDTNVNVFATLTFAKDAVGECPMDGESLRQITKALGSSGSADPLDQRGSVGWKAFQTWVILNDDWLIRGEFAATL